MSVSISINKYKGEKDDMKKSIEKHCLECWDDDEQKVIDCQYKDCPLWKYRLEELKNSKK